MTLDELRELCLSFPGATEGIQWEHDLLFRVGGKAFVFSSMNARPTFSIKVTDEDFARLIEIEGIVPSPYLARYKWVLVEDAMALKKTELKQLISASYEMVRSKLPKSVQKSLTKE
jgi:predicted DNA-binding protein (MmcQ/YjbR family)